MPGPGYTRRWRTTTVPYTILRITGQATEFVGFIILARRLEPSGFGELSIAFLICRYAGVIGDWGALTRGSRDVAAGGLHGSVRAFIRHRMTVTLTAATAVVIGMVLTGYPRLIPTVAVTLALGLSRDFIALGQEKGPRAAAPAALQGGLLASVSLLVWTVGGGAIAIGLGYGAAAGLSIALNRIPPEPAGLSGRAPAAWILLSVVAIQITSTADTILLGALRSTAEAGTYAAINRVPNAWVALISPLVLGGIPIMTRALSESAGEYRQLRRQATTASLLVAGIVAASAPVAYFLVPVLFGSDYASGQWTVVVLTLAAAVLTFGLRLHVFAVVVGRDRRYALIIAAAATVNIAVNLVVIPLYGMMGAAFATLISQTMVVVLLWTLAAQPDRHSDQRLSPGGTVTDDGRS
ncbi:MAG: polysaccharide biosynthesis C-terminal domain-containing protein [Actinobacteria bacterium]|nr:polysaccharide biosynthesis C-terminal domain-containing protein [Actinomycetota bacterium]